MNPAAVASVVLLAFSFFLGGASRQHDLRLGLVELAALPLLASALLALLRDPDAFPSPLATWIIGTIVAVPLLQLAPLPPALWTQLPGRDQMVLALNLADVPVGWATLSLSPDKTWRSFLALLPPLAIFLGVLVVEERFKRTFPRILLVAVGVAALLGAAQIASGGTHFYLWRTTDAGNVVGFFANRNHFATLCLLSLPFAGIVGGGVLRRGPRASRQLLWLSAVFIMLVTITLGVIRSRTGIALFAPVLAMSILAAWVAAGRGRPSFLLMAVGAGSAAGSMAVAIFALGPILARFDTVTSSEGRFENWGTVAQAANLYLPVGSGLGSFDAVYRSVEPLARLDATFFNQAHNDYLETWLEAGWFGIAILAAFLIWFVRRSADAWRGASSTERDLQRAASIAIGVVLLHSSVDYPIRTETIATLFALCCGLLELGHRRATAIDQMADSAAA